MRTWEDEINETGLVRDLYAEIRVLTRERDDLKSKLEQARAVLQRVRDGQFVPSYGTGSTEYRQTCIQLIVDIDAQLAARAQGEPAKEKE